MITMADKSDSPNTAITPVQPDDALDRSVTENMPGVLRGEVWLTLQTRHAQRIFMGRKATADKPYIIGLTRFGAIVSQIHVCTYMDDPWADWWLIKIEEALEKSEHEVKRLREVVEAHIKNTPGMEVKIAESLEPIRLPLQFRNPYAYQAARIIAEFDVLVRGVLTARHIGLMDRRGGERYRGLGARALRRALGTALGFKYQGVKRQDVRDGNAKAQQARERLGDVPTDVLEGTRRTRFAPERQELRHATDARLFTRARSLVPRWGAPNQA
jgi:integrating conjugative element protein (TIGR03761 family)